LRQDCGDGIAHASLIGAIRQFEVDAL